MNHLKRVRRDERGAFLLIMTISLVLLCILIAFALDLGQGRFSKRDSQQSADLASLAAGFYLSGNGSGATAESQPQAACEAAFNSVLTNTESFTPTATASSACSAFPTTNAACTDTTATITASDTDPSPGVQGGPYDLFIEWPVPDAVIADSRFDGSGAGLLDGDACDRMRVRIDKSDSTTFGRIIGAEEINTSVDAVVEGSPSLPDTGVAALLLLEREGCATLQTSGQGRVIVKTVTDPSSGNQQPGVIQSDSAGSTSFNGPLQCTTNNNARGYAIYGTQLPASQGGGPSIIAEDAPNGGLGVIATYAETIGGRGACCYPAGLSADPTGSEILSRTPADERFNPATRPAISDLHAAAWSAAVTNGPTVIGQVFTDCAPADNAVIQPTTANTPITINCGDDPFEVRNGRTVTIQNASSVKFIGGIDAAGTLEVRDASTVTLARNAQNRSAQLVVGNNGTVSFNSARNVYVGGEHTSGASIDVSGVLRINTGAVATAGCALGPGAGGTATNWTALATVGGEIDITGSVSLCQTLAYVGTSTSSYSINQRTSGGLNCTTTLPCPVLSTSDSRERFLLSGGGGSSIIWSAPNQTGSPPNATNPFEGLALWVEGTGLSQIKGTGTLNTTGVFILPNALFEFDGQSAASNPFNAQFFSRTLDFSGQGDLNLSPDPRDSIPTPIPGTYTIIR